MDTNDIFVCTDIHTFTLKKTFLSNGKVRVSLTSLFLTKPIVYSIYKQRNLSKYVVDARRIDLFYLQIFFSLSHSVHTQPHAIDLRISAATRI